MSAPKTLPELKLEWEEMVGEERIPEVFEILRKKVINNTYRTTLFVRYGEYNSNQKKEASGTADPRDLEISYAQIRNAFLNIIQRLTERDVKMDE